MEVVDIRNLTKVYSGVERLVVFDNANFNVTKGEIIGIVAPSGYGKSTLIHIIAGLDTFQSGSVVVLGRDIRKYKKKLIEFRRKYIGIVFQFFNLLSTLTALENVMLPMELISIPRKKAYGRAIYLLELVGLKGKENKFPYQLSGGEQQRVAFARALANNPPLILADEPTGNLDEKNAEHLFELMRILNEKEAVTIIIATHDKERALRYCHKIYTIHNKKIILFRE